MFVAINAPEDRVEGRHSRPHLPPGARCWRGEAGSDGSPSGADGDEGLPRDPRGWGVCLQCVLVVVHYYVA